MFSLKYLKKVFYEFETIESMSLIIRTFAQNSHKQYTLTK